VKLLKGWDCVLDRDSPAAALYEVWYRRLGTAVLKTIAPGAKSSMVDSLGASRIVRFLTQSTDRDQIMLIELSKAAAELRELQGPDLTKWKWGVLHQIRFQHGLGQFDIPPAARSGDTETVNSTGINRSAGYTQTTGASFRELIDLSDWDKSLAINTPGQSGDPENSHFADLYPLWLEGEYFPLVFSRTAIEAVAEQTITLTPTRTNHP
jgi:penicillin amidase